jgi:uncharacterized Fe-S cluster protein YjdI
MIAGPVTFKVNTLMCGHQTNCQPELPSSTGSKIWFHPIAPKLRDAIDITVLDVGLVGLDFKIANLKSKCVCTNSKTYNTGTKPEKYKNCSYFNCYVKIIMTCKIYEFSQI